MTDSPLRVHIVTQDDPLYVPAFFNEFFRLIKDRAITVTGVDVTPPLNEKKRFEAIRRAIGLFGWKGTLRIAGSQLISKLQDRLLPPARHAGSVSRICQREGVLFHVAPQINSREERKRISALKPDVLFSVAASQVFKPRLLAIPAKHALNVHNGRLPRYRGMLPVFWQLYEGCPYITISVHMMDEKLDTGLIALERKVDLRGEMSLHKIFRLCKVEAAYAVVEALDQVIKGTLEPRPQPDEEDGYFTFPSAKDSAVLRERGYQIP
jgi:methionyl-tRNA formyltransferase